MSRRAAPLESAEGIALMHWVRLMEPRYPALKYLFHVPSGGKRSKATAGRMKAEGVRRGVPDYLLPAGCSSYSLISGQRPPYVGLAIELKRQNASPSDTAPEQIEWHNFLRVQGWRVEVAKGADAAIAVIKDYLGMA
jgi:hypothetical protein